MKNKVLMCIFAALTIVTAVVIFVFSGQDGTVSGQSSGFLARFVEDVFGGVLPYGVADLIVRKGAHICVYFLLGITSGLTVKYYSRAAGVKYTWKWSALAVIFCMVYAISDEWHQSYVPGREGRALDVLIDSVGYVTANLIVWLTAKKD